MGVRLEDEVYDEHFVSLFHEDDQAVLQEDIQMVERGERPPYREVRMKAFGGDVVEVGVRMTLSFHDRSPAVQVTLTDLRTRVALIREQMRATLRRSQPLVEGRNRTAQSHPASIGRCRTIEPFHHRIFHYMMVAFNPDGSLSQYNQAFAVEFGLEFGVEPEKYQFRIL